MATIDIRGATLSAADPPIGTNPSPDLAWKAPVRAATTGGVIALSGLLTLDGIALAVGDRVLVKDQTDATTNGVYNAATGPWTRTIDAANNSQWARGLRVAVTDGALNAGNQFTCTAATPVTLGASALPFVPLTGTSGHAVPWLDGNNIWSGPQSMSVTVDNRNGYSAYNLWAFFEQSAPLAMGAGNVYAPAYVYSETGGTGLTGNRAALLANLIWKAASSNVGQSGQAYITIGAGCIAQSSDGGADTTYANSRGAIGAMNPVLILQSGAVNWFSANPVEINVAMQAGSSAFQKIGLLITKLGTDAVKASTVNAAICIADQAGAGTPWDTGIQFGEPAVHSGAQWPFDATSTLIGVTHPGSVGTAIDFTGLTIANYLLKSANFTVSGAGAVVTNGGVTVPGAVVGGATGIIQATATIDTGLAGNGIGFTRLNVGDASHTGFFAWFNPGGTRTAYMGFDNAAFLTMGLNAVDCAITGGGLFVGNSPAAVGAGNITASGTIKAGADLYSANASFLLRTTVTLNNAAAASTATLTNAPAAGNPTKWISIDDNGTTRRIPAW